MHRLKVLATGSTCARYSSVTYKNCPSSIRPLDPHLADGETKAQTVIQGAQVCGRAKESKAIKYRFPFSCLPGQVGMAQSSFVPDRQRPHQESRAAPELCSVPLLPSVIGGETESWRCLGT